MTKMQIIARAILLMMGFDLIISNTNIIVITVYSSLWKPTNFPWTEFLSSSAIFIFALLLGLFLTFTSDRLAKWMAGPGLHEDYQGRIKWAAASFRIAAVLPGIRLFPSIVITVLGIFTNARPFIRQVIIMKTSSVSDLISANDALNMGLLAFKVIICLYLVAGAPHITNYLIKQACIVNMREFKD